ncbi:MAG TPA: patatin-like phospholipase family protein, partial [Thermoanaerobaculia bacterium]
NRRIVDDAFTGAVKPLRDVRLKNVYDNLHAAAQRKENPRPRSALCISGGGIRSATFALGVIQGLARRNVLDKFDFVSTVSGGGYIGGWLSSWMRRHRDGARGVAEDLAKVPTDAIDPEPEPVRHLREYSNFLTPKLGLTSGDTWALAATYVRNVVLNWFILIPLLFAVLAAPRLIAALYFSQFFDDLRPWTPAFVHGALDYLSANAGWVWFGLGLVSFFTALGYLGIRRPRVNRYKRSGKGGDDVEFRRWCLIPLTAGAAFFAAAWAWYKVVVPDGPYPDRWAALVMIGGPVLVWIVDMLIYWRTDPAHRREDVAAQVRGKKPLRKKIALELLAALLAGTLSHFLLKFFAAVFPDPSQSFELDTFPSPILASPEMLPASPLYICLAVPMILAAFFTAASVFVGVAGNVNEDYDREWWARSSGWVLTAILGWPLLCATVIFGPVLIWFAPKLIAAAGGIGTLATVLMGRSSKSGDKEGEKTPLTDLAARLAAPVIILFLLAAISLATTEIMASIQGMKPPTATRVENDRPNADEEDEVKWLVSGTLYDAWDPAVARAWHHLDVVDHSQAPALLALIAGALLLSFLSAMAVNVNKFSMHAMYRNRLIRAYLGASRATRDPNPFTGFDPQDNLPYHSLRPELLWLTSFRDFGAFVARLKDARPGSFEEHLREELTDRKRNLFDDQIEPDVRRESLFQVLNCVLEEVDLSSFTTQKKRRVTLMQRITGSHMIVLAARDPRRLAANRRILDAHFKAEIYPFEAPLLHRGDVSDPRAFAHAFEHGFGLRLTRHFHDRGVIAALHDTGAEMYPTALARALGEVNRLLATVRFDDLLDDREPRPLDASHGMLENRRILEQHLGPPNADQAVVRPDGVQAPIEPALHKLRSPRPMHVVNAALNLVSGQNLAWQERKAESFTFSPLHSGSYRLGYRPSVEYGGANGVTLGTAITISGAAASPNMGYHSSTPLALLMTLFNVRLGWWLGNPGPHGDGTFRDASPTNALRPLVAEALGHSNDTFPYVYLSDGGHFENLALYEMVLRRRRFIVVSDAGCDDQFNFDDLGNAIRKIRTDFGIPIEMEEPMSLYPRAEGKTGRYCAVGRIRYSAMDGGVPDGVLLYLKPAVYLEGEPKDVFNYARSCAAFPHESTADQFFSESQFESYRALGSFAVEQLCTALGDEDLGLLSGEKRADPVVLATARSNWMGRSVDNLLHVARRYSNPRRERPTET